MDWFFNNCQLNVKFLDYLSPSVTNLKCQNTQNLLPFVGFLRCDGDLALAIALVSRWVRAAMACAKCAGQSEDDSS